MVRAGLKLLATAALMSMAAASAMADAPKFQANPPPSILTPDKVETSVGTLHFKDGAPDDKTVQLALDQLLLGRGIESFMKGMPATSVWAICNGLDSAGVKENQGIGITEDLMDARTLFLTPNTTTPYVFSCLNLNAGPMVVEVPPGVLGPVDDAYFRWVTDLGLTGPDQGRGGRYLFLPPGYEGPVPPFGFHVVKPRTNRLVMFYRIFVKDGDLKGAVDAAKATAKVYPLADFAKPPATTFVNTSGQQFNTISGNTFEFFSELDKVVQNEPADFVEPETVGLFSAIGIRKGQPFNPDDRTTKILTDAVALGNAAARSFLWVPSDKRVFIYPDRQWITPFVGGSYLFMDGAELMLNVRSTFFYYATGITPAMADAKPGTGSAYAAAFRDKDGNYLDGSKTYKITLPGPIPMNNFWSFTVYSNQTRSLLETDQKLAGVDSTSKDLKMNDDGSATVWFGPTPPKGHEGNWVQTMPGKGWNTLLRLYGPLEPWFDKSWKPGDFELVP
ncbi:hypothetical protein DK847_10210 [Aestuariivirga litoralis]|uniref:DUF1254 domain-containing protein n=1 Tax=Aestuariivirga litoralis TaxID=2650924 RepID=A0A2W2AMW5_9HYPH|nr:DUF1254 domain-containing protein [Aestuariivirga litoralis]PZF76835.1 hypothetical protein DK847_10210 [Aestuariivirga litoralis]